MNNLELYIPKLEELDFYQNMLSNPETMSYNAPWFPPNGCINFPKSKWEDFYNMWIGQEPKLFFAFLRLKEEGDFIGTVNFRYDIEKDWWDIGIVVLASERGKGYGKEGILLLIDRAFNKNGISRLHNYFERSRERVYQIHKDIGFIDMNTEDEDIHHLILTKDDYFKNK